MHTGPKDPNPRQQFSTPLQIAAFCAQGTGRKPRETRDERGRVVGWRAEMAQPRPVAQQAKVIVPRPRPRGAGRPAAARRTSSGSTTSSSDPGGDDSDEDSAAASPSRSAVLR